MPPRCSPSRHPTLDSRNAGSTLIEVLIALAVIIAVTAGLAFLLIWSRREAWSAGTQSAAVAIAAQKMEQLRALDWHTDAAGTRISDRTTNLSLEPATASGPGLLPSPPGALASDTPGFVDFVGVDGRWRGNGPAPPAGAAYVRRWSVAAYAADPADTLVLSVAVLPLVDAVRAGGRSTRGARLATLQTRVAR